jgi:hypothetical protein
MIGTLPIILAILFLLVMLSWLLWPPTGESKQISDIVGFPSRLIGERICSESDLRFVLQQAPELRVQFVRERKALMLLWLQALGGAVASAVQTHRAAASMAASIRPGVELRLAVDYAGFLILWRTALLLVWITNPFTAQFVTSRVMLIGEALFTAARELIPDKPPEAPDVKQAA